MKSSAKEAPGANSDGIPAGGVTKVYISMAEVLMQQENNEKDKRKDDLLQFTAESEALLIRAAQSGDYNAIEIILNHYKDAVKQNARAMYLIGGEKDDLIQEGMIALYKAVMDYDAGKGAQFATFANLCISRRLYSVIRASQTAKNLPLKDYISIDEKEEAEEDGESTVQNAEVMMLEKEKESYWMTELKKILSPLEFEILGVYLEEGDYKLVAKRLNRTPKAIDNALQRIRKKAGSIR